MGKADEEVWHVDLGLVLDVGSEDVWGMADVYFATRYISRPSKVLTSASELGHKLILEGPLRIWVAFFEQVGVGQCPSPSPISSSGFQHPEPAVPTSLWRSSALSAPLFWYLKNKFFDNFTSLYNK